MKKHLIKVFSFAIILFSSIAINEIKAADVGGKWEDVCCGNVCGRVGDYCVGSGDLICCK